MATIDVKSIGATGRNYATVILWNAACPADLTAVDKVWKGEMYNDSTDFGANLNIGGGITTDTARYMWLTSASGQGHSGKYQGVRWEYNSEWGAAVLGVQSYYSIIENFCIKNTGTNGYCYCIRGWGTFTVRKMILTSPNATNTGRYNAALNMDSAGGGAICYDNLVLDSQVGIEGPGWGGDVVFHNNTVYNAKSYGIFAGDGTSATKCRNNLVYAGSGATCFYGTFDSLCSNNISANSAGNDATAPGSNSQTNKTLANCGFTDSANGDFSITSSSVAKAAGYDLSSIFTTDIKGNTFGATFDIGAFAYVAATNKYTNLESNLRGLNRGINKGAI